MLAAATRLYRLLDLLGFGSTDLQTYVGGIGDVMFQEVEDLASDGPLGQPGWSSLLDLNRVPDKALPWLAQFIGVSIPGGLTPADQRIRIQNTDGWKRGTPAAIAGAPLPYLTGTKTVILRERDPAASPNDPAYGLTVITRTSETPAADLPATNICTNGDFEVNTVGWAGPVGGSILSSDPAYKKFGARSLKVVTDGSVANQGAFWNSPAGQAIPAGTPVSYGTWVRPDVGVQLTLFSRIVHTDASVIQSQTQITPVGDGMTFYYLSQTLNVTAGKTGDTVAIGVRVLIGATLATNFWADGFMLELNPVPTPFVNGSRVAGFGPVGDALRAQKPAGILLNYNVLAGADYDILLANNPLYSNVFANFLTYQGVINNVPGT